MAILATERVLTLDWWKPAAKLEVGDYVFDKNGKIVKIRLVQHHRPDHCYEVMFSDYLTTSGDSRLGFLVEDTKYRKRISEYLGVLKFRRPLKHKTVEDLLDDSLKDKRDRSAYSVPTTAPISLPHQDLPVPPFVFGFWFFNRKAYQKLNAPSGRHDEVVEKLKDYGYKVKLGRKRPGGRQEFTISPTIESQLAPNIPSVIPNNYLLASIEQRLELLSGIILAKGSQYNTKHDTFQVTSQNNPTITRIQCLAETLGIKTAIEHNERLGNFTLFFKTRHQLVKNQASPAVKLHHGRRFITEITPLPSQTCVYIETTGDDNTILVGEGFIPCR
jgi:hypothetical protein